MGSRNIVPNAVQSDIRMHFLKRNLHKFFYR